MRITNLCTLAVLSASLASCAWLCGTHVHTGQCTMEDIRAAQAAASNPFAARMRRPLLRAAVMAPSAEEIDKLPPDEASRAMLAVIAVPPPKLFRRYHTGTRVMTATLEEGQFYHYIEGELTLGHHDQYGAIIVGSGALPGTAVVQVAPLSLHFFGGPWPPIEGRLVAQRDDGFAQPGTPGGTPTQPGVPPPPGPPPPDPQRMTHTGPTVLNIGTKVDWGNFSITGKEFYLKADFTAKKFRDDQRFVSKAPSRQKTEWMLGMGSRGAWIVRLTTDTDTLSHYLTAAEAAPVKLGRRYVAEMTWTNDVVKFYIDGAQKFSAPLTGTLVTKPELVTIGGNPDPRKGAGVYSGFFRGTIHEIIVGSVVPKILAPTPTPIGPSWQDAIIGGESQPLGSVCVATKGLVPGVGLVSVHWVNPSKALGRPQVLLYSIAIPAWTDGIPIRWQCGLSDGAGGFEICDAWEYQATIGPASGGMAMSVPPLETPLPRSWKIRAGMAIARK